MILFATLMAIGAQTAPAPAAACPVLGVEEDIGKSGDLIFYLTADPVPEGKDYGFSWTVSAGRIAAGQGSANISVSAPKGVSVTATVEVSGLPAGCARSASATAETP